MEGQKIRLSKSMMNSFDDYINGDECGVLFHAMYIGRTHSKSPSPPMLKGNRFEYIAIGTKNRDGSVPPEILTPQGNISKTDEQRVRVQAQKFHEVIEEYEIEMEETDEKFEIEFENYTLVWVEDYSGTWKGRRLIGDLKYTGLLYKKYEPTGWHRENLHEKKKLMTQPLLYLYGRKWLSGEEYDFMFHIHSSSNDIDHEVFQIHATEDHIQDIELRIDRVLDNIRMTEEMGFRYNPSIRRCLECPIMDCPKRMRIPTIKHIHLIW